jgi:hypothetical protein
LDHLQHLYVTDIVTVPVIAGCWRSSEGDIMPDRGCGVRAANSEAGKNQSNATPVVIASLLIMAACTPMVGYPDNPDDNQTTKTALTNRINANESAYYQAAGPYVLSQGNKTWTVNTLYNSDVRRQLRDTVVYDKMRLSEIEFNRFQKHLWGDNNLVSDGGDLLALALNGLGATTGTSATKAALAAASAGVVGAQAAISRDLYYQRTLPALLAQISANRDNEKSEIISLLKSKTDADYPLGQAETDLQVLQRDSGISGAIETITERASSSAADAATKLKQASVPNQKFAASCR